jgi:hypothetical protein
MSGEGGGRVMTFPDLQTGVPSDDDLRRGENEVGVHLGTKFGGRGGGGVRRGGPRTPSKMSPRGKAADLQTPETYDDESSVFADVSFAEEGSDTYHKHRFAFASGGSTFRFSQQKKSTNYHLIRYGSAHDFQANFYNSNLVSEDNSICTLLCCSRGLLWVPGEKFRGRREIKEKSQEWKIISPSPNVSTQPHFWLRTKGQNFPCPFIWFNKNQSMLEK